MAESGVSFLSTAIRELRAKPADAKAARSPALCALRSVEAHLKTVKASEISLREEMGRLRSVNTGVDN